MNAKCKTGKGMGAMRMADGGTVSPYTIRGLHRRAVEGTTNLMEKLVPIQSATERYNAAHPAPTVPATVAPAPSTPAPVTPAPTPPSQTPAPSTALGDYSSGQTEVLKRREREAGMKDGGALRTGKGGAVPGKGKGDKIPAKYEPGEFVVSNAMRRNAPGLIGQLHALRNHTLAKEGKTPAQADAGRFKGGAIRALNGLDPVEEERRARLMAQIPTMTRADVPEYQGGGEPVNSTELGRNISNTLSAIAPIAPVLTGARALANASTLAPKVGGVISNLASRVAPVMPYAVPAAGAAALHAASSPAAGAPAVQPSAPVAVPATPAPAVTSPTASVQSTAPSAAQRFGKFAPATLQDAGPVDEAQRVAGGRAVGAQDMALANQMESDRLTQAAISQANGEAAVRASQEGEAADEAKRRRWSAEGTMSSITATPAQKAVAAQTLQSLNSRDLAAENNASMTQRAGMTDATARRAQDINAASQGAISKLAREKFARETTGLNLDNASKKRVADAQSKLIDPNASESDRAHARETLRALLGKDKEVPSRFTVVPEYDGNGVRTGTTVLDQSGQVVDLKAGTKSLPPGLVVGAPYKGAEGDHRLPNGGVMTVKNGKVVAIK